MGAAGTIAKVNHGYARNYLVPNKLAVVRRGKQAGSVDGIQEQSNTSSSSSSAAMAAAGGASTPSAALTEEEREKLLVAKQKRSLESAVKKLTTQTLVRTTFFFYLHAFSLLRNISTGVRRFFSLFLQFS
jgi:ribosomal protein L9